MSITSADDGKTWSNRRMVYASTGTGNSAGAPQVINVGGRLVVSFQTSEDSNLGQTGAYTYVFSGAYFLPFVLLHGSHFMSH